MSIRPAGHSWRLAAAAGLATMLMGACTDATPTAPPDAPGLPSASTASGAASTTTVHIIGGVQGPTKFTQAGMYTYRADVGSGTAPYRYDWFQTYCYWDGLCSELQWIRGGVGLSSIQIYLPEEIMRTRFVVHVYDSEEYPAVATGDITTTNMIQPPSTPSQVKCELPSGPHFGFYPVKDFDAPDENHTQYYRRNPCTGAREYQPVWGAPQQ